MLPEGWVTTDRSDRELVVFENLQPLPRTEAQHPANQRTIHSFPGDLPRAGSTLRPARTLHAGDDS